jgi:hypothetical protein
MMHGLGEQATVVLRMFSILGDGSIEVGQERLLDFPVVHFGSDAELEIFLGDRIPILCLR